MSFLTKLSSVFSQWTLLSGFWRLKFRTQMQSAENAFQTPENKLSFEWNQRKRENCCQQNHLHMISTEHFHSRDSHHRAKFYLWDTSGVYSWSLLPPFLFSHLQTRHLFSFLNEYFEVLSYLYIWYDIIIWYHMISRATEAILWLLILPLPCLVGRGGKKAKGRQTMSRL